jgi:ribosomal 30S subunit maturation factor RimM
MEFENGELPLPVIDDVVKKVDIENRNIYVNMIDGL